MLRCSSTRAAAAAVLSACLFASPALAEPLSKAATACQRAVGQAGAKFQSTEAKAWRFCLNDLLSGDTCDSAELDTTIREARAKARASIEDKCTSDALFAARPAGAGFPQTCALVLDVDDPAAKACSNLPVNSPGTLADCLLCWKELEVRRHLNILYPCLEAAVPDGGALQCGTAPASCPTDTKERYCIRTIAAAELTDFLTREKALESCLQSVAAGKSSGPCPDAATLEKFDKSTARKNGNLADCASTPGWWDVCPYDPSAECTSNIASVSDIDTCATGAATDSIRTLVCQQYPMAAVTGIPCPALPACGDRYVNTPNEECDDGNLQPEDGCSATCIVEECGDGILQAGLGEECDNGNANSDTAADACRTNCKLPSCSDGVADTGEDCSVACAAGTEETEPGNPPTCRPCTPGEYCAGGSTPAVACGGTGAAATWDDDGDPATPCALQSTCPAGTFVFLDGDAITDRTCNDCAAGTWNADDNAAGCAPWTDCGAGTSVSTDGDAFGDRTCSDCLEGTYSSEPNQAECLPQDSCAAGTQPSVPVTNTAAVECTPCSVGEYCAGGSAAAVSCGTTQWDHDSDPATPCVDVGTNCNASLTTIAPPTLGPAPHLGYSTTRSILFRGNPVDLAVSQTVSGNSTDVFDASAFVDPSDCDQSQMHYWWRVTYIQVDGSEISPYTVQGITGYITPTLTINPNAMPAGNAYVDLKVTSGSHPDQFTQVRIFFTIDATTRALVSYYLQCKATNTLCNRSDPNCLCFIPALLPTTEPTS